MAVKCIFKEVRKRIKTEYLFLECKNITVKRWYIALMPPNSKCGQMKNELLDISYDELISFL